MTNKADKLYQELTQQMESEAIISQKMKEMREVKEKLEKHQSNLKNVSEQCDRYEKKVKSPNIRDSYSLIDALNIETLRESCEMELGKKSDKVKFKDVSEFVQLCKEEAKIKEETQKYSSQDKISEIEVLQAKIEFLLKKSNNEV